MACDASLDGLSTDNDASGATTQAFHAILRLGKEAGPKAAQRVAKRALTIESLDLSNDNEYLTEQLCPAIIKLLTEFGLHAVEPLMDQLVVASSERTAPGRDRAVTLSHLPKSGYHCCSAAAQDVGWT